MSKVYLALYKGRKSGRGLNVAAARFADWVIRTITRSPHSHCEIAVVDEVNQYPPHITCADNTPAPTVYACYSSSFRDGGVRRKLMPLPPEKWDFIELPENAAAAAQELYGYTVTKGYDIIGMLAVLFCNIHSKSRWFCSEWCAQALGLPDPHNYTPAGLAREVTRNKR